MSALNPMPTPDYVYRASPIRTIDGDTIEVQLDQGLHTYRTERLRILGVNAPEPVGDSRPAGLDAKTYTSEWLTAADQVGHWPLIVRTRKADVFGRYLAQVWRVVDGASLGDDLIREGHAVVDLR